MATSVPSNKSEIVASWVEQFGDHLYAWALKSVDESTAKDLVQETYLSAFRNFEQFKGDSSPSTWLHGILRNKVIDQYRKATKLNEEVHLDFFDVNGNWQPNELESAWQADHSEFEDYEDFESVVSNCLNDLPANWRACISAKYLLGKKGTEICQELGITPSNYWQMLHRGKLTLKKCLEINWHIRRLQ